MIALASAASSTSAWDQPGTIAFLVVFGMVVVCFFLFRSMAKHLRKVREAARIEEETQAAAPAGQTVSLADGTVTSSPAGNGADSRT